jgi:hypothetical protein
MEAGSDSQRSVVLSHVVVGVLGQLTGRRKAERVQRFADLGLDRPRALAAGLPRVKRAAVTTASLSLTTRSMMSSVSSGANPAKIWVSAPIRSS